MKTVFELTCALILGACIGTMLIYCLDADLEARDIARLSAVVKGGGK